MMSISFIDLVEPVECTERERESKLYRCLSLPFQVFSHPSHLWMYFLVWKVLNCSSLGRSLTVITRLDPDVTTS